MYMYKEAGVVWPSLVQDHENPQVSQPQGRGSNPIEPKSSRIRSANRSTDTLGHFFSD